MSFFDFDLPVESDSVNVEDDLNFNLDELENKLTKVRQRPFPVVEFPSVPIGLEVYNPDGSTNRIASWTGNIWQTSLSYRIGWQSWINLEPYLVAGRSFRPNFPPQGRYNPVISKVELRGSVRFNSSGDGWGVGGTAVLRIPYSIIPRPSSSWSSFITAADHTTADSSGGFRAFQCRIVRDDVEEWTSIIVVRQGDNLATGNSAYLDNTHWWVI